MLQTYKSKRHHFAPTKMASSRERPRILFSEGAALRVEAPCVHHYLSTRM